MKGLSGRLISFMSGKSLSPEEGEFHLEEYRALRSEISEKLRYIFESERNALLASAGLYAWAIDHNHSLFFWALPALLTIFSIFRVLSFYERINEMAAYLRGIEQLRASSAKTDASFVPLFGTQRAFQVKIEMTGWEHFLLLLHPHKIGHGLLNGEVSSPSVSSAIFWGGLLLANLVALVVCAFLTI